MQDLLRIGREHTWNATSTHVTVLFGLEAKSAGRRGDGAATPQVMGSSPGQHAAAPLLLSDCELCLTVPKSAWFMTNGHLWEGNELTQTAHESFDSRLVR